MWGRPCCTSSPAARRGFDLSGGFASNGYEDHSPGKYSLFACFIMEVTMTAVFLFVIMGATHGKAPAGFAPLAIGLALVMIHLVSIPVTNTSVNPCAQHRSRFVRRRLGGATALAVLGRAADRWASSEEWSIAG